MTHDDWYFEYETPADQHFVILAGPPPREIIAEKVPSKELAWLMSSAPKMLAALKQCRQFLLDQPEVLNVVDDAIATAEGEGNLLESASD